MRTENEIIIKIAELLARRNELIKAQIIEENSFEREMRAYGLWSIDDRIAGLQWTINQLSPEEEEKF